jgi:hypothetical protein
VLQAVSIVVFLYRYCAFSDFIRFFLRSLAFFFGFLLASTGVRGFCLFSGRLCVLYRHGGDGSAFDEWGGHVFDAGGTLRDEDAPAPSGSIVCKNNHISTCAATKEVVYGGEQYQGEEEEESSDLW